MRNLCCSAFLVSFECVLIGSGRQKKERKSSFQAFQQKISPIEHSGGCFIDKMAINIQMSRNELKMEAKCTNTVVKSQLQRRLPMRREMKKKVLSHQKYFIF